MSTGFFGTEARLDYSARLFLLRHHCIIGLADRFDADRSRALLAQ